jgi:hypothetical protein
VSHSRNLSIGALILSSLAIAAARPAAPQRLDIALSARPVDPPCVFIDTWQQPRAGGRLHEGVDIVTSAGSPIYAVVDGTISKIYLDAPGSRSGNGFRLAMADGTYFFYAHMQKFVDGLQVGSSYQAGDVIGYVGHTGNTLLDHLHLEVHPAGGDPINPFPIVTAAKTCKIAASPTGVIAPPLSDAPTPTPTTTPTTLLAPATRTPSAEPPPTTVGPATPPATTAVTQKPPQTTPPTTQAVPPQVAPTTAPKTGAAKGMTVVGPLRVADSRFGTANRLRTNNSTEISIARLGVPASISSAQITVWSVGSAADGYLTVFPCGTTVPLTSTLNFTAGQTISASAFAGVSGGKICVFSSVASDVIVDVSAYSDGKTPAGVIATAPFRAFDSAWAGNRVVKNTERAVRVAGAAGMPAAATAVTVTLTTSGATARSSLQAYACGGSPSGVPIVVGGAGETNSAAGTVKVSANGAVCFLSNVDLDLIVDVHIAWAKGGAQLQSITPARLLDTRSGATLGAGATKEVKVAGVSGIPAGATSAAVNVTITGGSSATQVVVWPCGKKKPNTVVVAAGAGKTASGGATVNLGSGKLCVTSSTSAHVVVDVTGFAQ